MINGLKKELCALLVAFGVCANYKQANNYLKNKDDAQLKEIYKTINNKSKYIFYND